MGIKKAHERIIGRMNLLMDSQRADFQQILERNLDEDERQDFLNSINCSSRFFDGLEYAAEIIEEECPEVLEDVSEDDAR